MIINRTPHDVVYIGPTGDRSHFPASKQPPVRLIRQRRQGPTVPAFTPGEERLLAIVQDATLKPKLPPERPGVLYIVSRLAFEATDRWDVIQPMEVFRTPEGGLACRGFRIKGKERV